MTASEKRFSIDPALVKRKNFWEIIHLDGLLILSILLLMAYGLFILYSASDRHVTIVLRQSLHFALAFVAMLCIAQLSPRYLYRCAPFLYVIGIALLIAVLILGSHSKGAQRWLQIPGLPRFQPAEIMKLVVPMTVAWYLAEYTLPPKSNRIIGSLLIIFVPTLLIAAQPDLGTALLISSSGLFVLFLSGLPWSYIFGFIAISGLSAPGLWYFLHDYQRKRVLTFLDPESDPLGAGWNIIQSKTAIGSGGFSGKGWLQGTQSHLDFLPESSTDFIIAVCAEELGLLGILLLLTLYSITIARGLYMSMRAPDSFGRLLSGSIILTLFIYIFVNIGMVSGLLPVVGVPLPLISYGGTSVVTLMLSFGMVMSIYTHKRLHTY